MSIDTRVTMPPRAAEAPMGVPFLDLASMTADASDDLNCAWQAVTRNSAFIGGEHVAAFESRWARYCGTRESVGVGNGTDAIELALRGLGVGPGDEVIVPANTFIATAEAVVAAGATPRFVDVEDDTLLIDPDAVNDGLGPRTAALIVVHLFGQTPDMDRLCELAEHAGIAVVEDAAQAHGATWRGRRAGSFGAAGCFSFYPGKNLGAFGDAGAIVTNDAQLAQTMRSVGDHGRAATSKHDHPRVGRNSRLDGLQAAVLSAKLPHLDRWNAARRAADTRYRQRLGDVVPLVAQRHGAQGVFHLEVARVTARDSVRAALCSQGIATGIHYPVPCHRHDPYGAFPRGDLAVTEQAAQEILSLPMFPHLSDGQIDTVCQALLQEVLR